MRSGESDRRWMIMRSVRTLPASSPTKWKPSRVGFATRRRWRHKLPCLPSQCHSRKLVTRQPTYTSRTEMESHAASSVMDAAANSGAELIDQLGSILYVGGAAIFIMVMILAIYGVYGPRRPINARRWIIGGGLVFPAVTLTVLLVYS